MISGNDETIAGERKQHFASFATQSELICTWSEEVCVLQLLPVPLRMQQLLGKKEKKENRAKHTELQTPPTTNPHPRQDRLCHCISFKQKKIAVFFF